MSNSLANTLFVPVLPDWPAGPRLASPEPESGEGFDAHLQLPKPAGSAPPEKGISQPESQATAVESQDSETETEHEASGVMSSDTEDDQSHESGDEQLELAELQSPDEVVQSLSGAAAVVTVAIEPAVVVNNEATPAAPVDVSLDALVDRPPTVVVVESAQPPAAAPTVPPLAPVALPDDDNGPSQDVVVASMDHSPVMIAVGDSNAAMNSRTLDNKSPTPHGLVEDTQQPRDLKSATAQVPSDDSRATGTVRSEADRPQTAGPVVAETASPAARPIEVAPLPANPSGSETTTAGPPIANVNSADAPRSAVPAEVFAPDRPNAGPVAAADVDSVRLLHRVARAFAAAAERQGEVTIRLSPPELGALRLEARVEDGMLTARMQAETPEAQATILENLSVLRERLAEQGVRIERFDVDLMNRQPGQSPHEPFGERRDMPRIARPTADHRPAEQPTVQNLPRTIQAGSGRLNVIV
jgi:flagellar hook-length control protein FliK